MHGAIVSKPLLRNSWIAAVAKSTSQVTMPMTAPFETTLSTQDLETSGFEFWVSQLETSSFAPFTPPRPLIFFASRSRRRQRRVVERRHLAAEVGGEADDDFVLADFAPDAVVTPTAATATATTSASAPARPHLFVPLMLPSLSCCLTFPTRSNRARPRSASSRGGSRQSESSNAFPNVPSSENTSRS